MSVGLGSLPFFINLLTQFITVNISYNSVFRVNDLMFFCIFLNATVMYDLFLIYKPGKTSSPLIISWFILLFLTLIIAVIIGISSYFAIVQPVRELYNLINYRLTNLCLILVVLTIISNIGLQMYFSSKYEK